MRVLTVSEINAISGGMTNREVIWECGKIGGMIGLGLGFSAGLILGIATLTVKGILINTAICTVFGGMVGGGMGLSFGEELVKDNMLDQEFKC